MFLCVLVGCCGCLFFFLAKMCMHVCLHLLEMCVGGCVYVGAHLPERLLIAVGWKNNWKRLSS